MAQDISRHLETDPLSQRGNAVLNNRVWYVALALITAGAGLAVPGHAFTLGELRGAALIGRPLDVSVQVHAGPGEDAAATCFAVEVYHADVRQLAPSVTVAGSKSDAGERVVLRVQSAGVVDEPVVSLVMRSTCGAIATRRYVLLADLPPIEPSAPLTSAVASANSPTQPGQASSRPLLDPASVAKMPMAARTPRANSSVAGTVSPATARKAQARAASRSMQEPDSSKRRAKSVLKLDPLDLLSDRMDSLNTLMAFDSTQNAPPQPGQVASLQGDIKVLQDKAVKNDARLAQLRAQLQQAQDQSVPVTWFYLLLALLLAALAAAATLWWRQRATHRAAATSWHDQSLPKTSAPPMPAPELLPAEPAKLEAPPVVKPEVPVQPQVSAAEPVTVAAPLAVDSLVPEPPEAAATGFGGIHSLSVEPILDIRQQAEFFVSLGQTERALRILTKQIADMPEPNPFIYMDLLAL